TVDELKDIMVNARAMAAISHNGGNFGAWSVYTGPDGVGSNGPWRNHLPKARSAVADILLNPDHGGYEGGPQAGWESVARHGHGIARGVGLGDVVDLGAGIVRDPIGTMSGILGGALGPLDGLVSAAAK